MLVLTNGEMLYSVEEVNEKLLSIGIDVVADAETLVAMLVGKSEEDSKLAEDAYEEQERIADHYYNAAHSMGMEIIELAEKLETGKGGTKVQYADKFKKIVDYYLD